MAGTKELPRQRVVDCTKKMKSITRKAKQLVERRTKMTKRIIQSVKKWQTKYKTASADMEKKNKQLTNEFYKQYEYCEKIKKRNPNDEDLINMVSILTDEKFDFDTSNLSKVEENFIEDFVKL
jgi:vacuolar-type H+-ATPase subunit I/STV1